MGVKSFHMVEYERQFPMVLKLPLCKPFCIDLYGKMTKSTNLHIKIKLSAPAFCAHIAGFMVGARMLERDGVSDEILY